MCDQLQRAAVYRGVRAKERAREDTKMFKTMIAGAAVIALLAGAAAMNTTADTKTLGGWTAAEETEISAEAQEIFDEATDQLIGVDYEAVELIETQIVNGTNYKFRAESRVVRPGAEKKTVTVTIHQALDGTVTILEIAE